MSEDETSRDYTSTSYNRTEGHFAQLHFREFHFRYCTPNNCRFRTTPRARSWVPGNKVDSAGCAPSAFRTHNGRDATTPLARRVLEVTRRHHEPGPWTCIPSSRSTSSTARCTCECFSENKHRELFIYLFIFFLPIPMNANSRNNSLY